MPPTPVDTGSELSWSDILRAAPVYSTFYIEYLVLITTYIEVHAVLIILIFLIDIFKILQIIHY